MRGGTSATLALAAPSGPLAGRFERLVVAGWAARDEAAVRHHIAELAALGVRPPREVPLFYRVAASLLTTDDAVQVAGTTLPSLQALVDTSYGCALLVNLGLLASVLAIGASNFLLGGRGPFGRLIVVELLLALALFVATGFLTSLPPASGT